MRQKSIAVLVVAAGKGERVSADGSSDPKQYRLVAGKPVLARTISAFLGVPNLTRLVTVIHADHAGRYAALRLDDDRLLPPVVGGASRQASVLEGLKALAPHKFQTNCTVNPDSPSSHRHHCPNHQNIPQQGQPPDLQELFLSQFDNLLCGRHLHHRNLLLYRHNLQVDRQP